MGRWIRVEGVLTRRTQASEVRSLKTQLKFAESAICEHQTRADDAELQV